MARKKLVFIPLLLIVLLFALTAEASWQAQNSNTTNALYDIHFVNSTTGWAVGASGTIRKTTDGGATTWSTQTSGTTQALMGISVISTDTAYVAGNSGVIRKTTNGGSNWNSQTSGVSQNLSEIYFPVDANTGWVVGASGVIRKTTNGGTNWNGQTSGVSQTLNDLYFADNNTGWVVGNKPGGSNNGVILKTTNGGTNWNSQTSGVQRNLNGVYFVDANTGWITGDNGTILKTINGGTNWTAQTSGTTNILYDVFMIDSLTGWVVGESGTVLVTSDGGTTWTAQTLGTTQHLYGVDFNDIDNGWTSGANGTIRKSPYLTVSLTANPSSGTNPLTIDLTADVGGTASGNIVYKFDCTNDGSYEHTSSPTTTDPYTAAGVCTYATPGTYTAKTVATREGITKSSTTTVTVTLRTLTVSLTASPDTGTNPLEGVNLTAIVGGTATGNIVYKFDCTNDGSFEHTSAPTSQTTYTAAGLCTYANPGTFTAKVVAERQSLTAENTTNIVVTQRTLSVTLSASPDNGVAPLNGVSLTGNVSGNATGNIVYKFDCTNDGSFEHTSAPTTNTTYTASGLCSYADPGTYTAKVEVTRQGLTANNTTTITVVPLSDVLSVSLIATPNSGVAPLNGVDLTAAVTGTATGNIVYKFDCTNDGTFEHTSSPTSQTTYTATDVCNYADAGNYTAKVVADRGGYSNNNTTSITVSAPTLTVSLNASPNSGTNPLENVSLIASVGGTATGNINYKFDCTNDGTYEHTSSPVPDTTYTATNLCAYANPGTYTARVEVTRGNDGILMASDTTTITVTLRTLTVLLTADPNSGTNPLTGVDLTATIGGNATGNIVYQFDCTNDGTYEHTSSPTGNTTYTATDVCTYADSGNYTAKVLATRQGLTAQSTTNITVTQRTLNASLSASPDNGVETLSGVSLTANVTGNATGNTIYKFDCTNDGTYEHTSASVPETTYTAPGLCSYGAPGTYTAKVEAVRQGLTAQNTTTINVIALSAALSVTMTATPNSGVAPLNNVGLSATVTGSATGTIVYKFDCNDDGTFEHTSAPTTNTTYAVTGLCNYADTGTYTAKTEVTRAGLTNSNTTTITVTAGTLAVSLSASPNSGTNPLTGVDLTASVSGTATGNITYKFDCTNDGIFEHTSASTTQTPYTASNLCSYADPGTYTAKVEATRRGLVADSTTTITVSLRTLSVSLTADSNTGTNPLTGVDLTATVGGSATGNIVYQFDCTNDGIFEHTSAPTTGTTYTATDVCDYSDPGNYTAQVVATRQGVTAQNTTNIVVIQRTLSVALSVNPSDGVAPLSGVDLAANVSGNATGAIVYSFDCNNDDIFEHTSSATTETTYTATDVCGYSDAGTFVVRARAERQGLTADDTTLVTVITSDAALAVSLTATPNSGTVPLNGVGLEATVSGVATGDITYKFDCDNNGTYEHTSSPTLTNPYSASGICNYTNPGNYTARVDVDRLFGGTETSTAQTITKSATAGITVLPPPLVITTSGLLASGTVNLVYTATIEAAGGAGTKIFSLLTGALPNGLVLNPNGGISGTPVQDGIFHFVIAVTDSQPVVKEKKFDLFIAPPPTQAAPQTSVVATTEVDPSAGGGATLVNPTTNTEATVAITSSSVSGVNTYSIVISSYNNQSNNFVAVPATTGNLLSNLNYEVQVINDTTAQEITGFNNPITITISYLDSEIPSGSNESQIKIYFYNEVTALWEPLETTVDTANNIATATVNHLTRFALVTSAAAIVSLPGLRIPEAEVPITPPKVGAQRVDFNGDSRVNLVDFSILAYWYNKPTPPTDLDVNKDGKINLVEFSTLIYYWTR